MQFPSGQTAQLYVTVLADSSTLHRDKDST